MDAPYRFEVRTRTRCRGAEEADTLARRWAAETGGTAVIRLPLWRALWVPALAVVARYGGGR